MPLTGMDAGLLTTTMSSSMWIILIGSAAIGTSCLKPQQKRRYISLLRPTE